MTKAIARDPIYRRRRFQPEVIELCERWYLTYRLSYRNVEQPSEDFKFHSSTLVIGSWKSLPTSARLQPKVYSTAGISKQGRIGTSVFLTLRLDRQYDHNN